MRKSFAKRLFKFVIVAGCVVAGIFMNMGNKQFAANQTRTYFIAADEVSWDYAPSGINQVTGQPFDEVANVLCRTGRSRSGKYT